MADQTRTWANLVGKDGNEAVEVIKRESGLTNVHIVSPGSMCTMDYRTDRVRVHVNAQGKVATPPSTG